MYPGVRKSTEICFLVHFVGDGSDADSRRKIVTDLICTTILSYNLGKSNFDDFPKLPLEISIGK